MGTWKFKVEANNPLSTFAPDEWIGLYLVISLWHSHLRSVWNVTPKRWKWEGYTASVITPLARVQLQLQTAVAYSCGCVNLCWRKNKVFGFADAWIYVDAKIKYSVSPMREFMSTQKWSIRFRRIRIRVVVALDTSFLHQTDREWPKPCPLQRHPGAMKPFP